MEPQINKSKILIRQPFGIGDILFISPIVRQIDYNMLWPVEPHYIWIKEYLDIPNVKFITTTEYYSSSEYSELDILDFLNAEPVVKNLNPNIDCMTAKYEYANWDIAEWRSLYWKRDFKKENLLMQTLGLTSNTKYNLINQNFAEPKLNYKTDLNIQNGYKNIYMDYVDGFTLLDWGMVIENSSEFHTVSTSTFYMVEFLDCIKTKLHLYPRYGLDKNLNPIRPLISERWTCHE